MAQARKVAVLVGSLRAGSFNRKLAEALIGLAPENLDMEIVEIGDLPIYNPDLDTDTPPPAWTAFRQTVGAAEAVLFVTPEYNRSVPAVLKNALDVGSRPYGHNIWSGKPGAVISASPGAIGGFGANHHLRQSLVFLNVLTMQQPETYISGVDKLFDENGVIANEGTAKFLGGVMEAYGRWVQTILG